MAWLPVITNLPKTRAELAADLRAQAARLERLPQPPPWLSRAGRYKEQSLTTASWLASVLAATPPSSAPNSTR
jgi:hypothetical protein